MALVSHPSKVLGVISICQRWPRNGNTHNTTASGWPERMGKRYFLLQKGWFYSWQCGWDVSGSEL
ncbi:hypothetical protein Q9966_000052 [Columba livia]|nr:hypothetical protein Q9966_000052 [Columba livia]